MEQVCTYLIRYDISCYLYSYFDTILIIFALCIAILFQTQVF